MIKNYIKITWRNLWKNKLFSSINIFGLALGLATCFILTLYIFDEVSYDTHHSEASSVYRLYMESAGEQLSTSAGPLAEELKNEFPEITETARVLKFPNIDKFLLKNETDDVEFYETNGYYVDARFFDVLTYDFKYGNPKTALNTPNTIVLSEKVATKLFGDIDPTDRNIAVETPFGTEQYKLTAVYRDTYKSHINANFVLSMKNAGIGQWVDAQEGLMGNNLFHTYLKLDKNSSKINFEEKLPAFVDRHIGTQLAELGFERSYHLQAVEDIYLTSNMMWELSQNGSMTYIYIFSAIALFLLIIACINFMNLSTARSEKRAKEVGMRKVLGANKKVLIFQFLSESLAISFISLFVAVLLVISFLPVFNAIVQKQLTLFQYPNIALIILVLTLVTGIISGLYPAFYLSSFKPITVLKGKLINSISAKNIRKGLVIFQFTVSAALILVAGIVWQQMDFLQEKDMGFQKERQLLIPYRSTATAQNYTTLKSELLKDPRILSATAGDAYPGIQILSDNTFYADGKGVEDGIWTRYGQVHDDYIKTLGYELLSGRDFSKNSSKDSLGVILNETAVSQLGYTSENAVGRKIFYDLNDQKHQLTIIGVIGDFNFKSLHEPIAPYALRSLGQNQASYFIATLEEGNINTTLKNIESIWNRINPGTPLEYTFLNQDFNKNYRSEVQTSTVVYGFMFIAIFIACIGLFGLASFTTEQRRKEVGIRRVLGASIFSITAMQLKDFFKLILIAVLIASPLAYFLGAQWLQNFAYKVSVGWQLFAGATIIALTIAFLTIGFQVIKAAIANPVKSLRTE